MGRFLWSSEVVESEVSQMRMVSWDFEEVKSLEVSG